MRSLTTANSAGRLLPSSRVARNRPMKQRERQREIKREKQSEIKREAERDKERNRYSEMAGLSVLP